MFEFLFPYEMKFDVQNVLEEIRAYNQTTRETITSMGLDDLVGNLQITVDQEILKALDIT